jgi:aspartate/methionine/tyrosine aminotransferase
MMTEQDFFDEEAWEDWDASYEELNQLYEAHRDAVWEAFNALYMGKLYQVSETTKSYLFADFKRQYFANLNRDKKLK